MSKDNSRLSRLGVLAPAALSACMDASVLAVPAAGAIVSTVLKELSKAFMLKKWFHGKMSTKEAEQLMMTKGKNGSFLVRESQARPGELVLSVRVRGRVSHVMIRRQEPPTLVIPALMKERDAYKKRYTESTAHPVPAQVARYYLKLVKLYRDACMCEVQPAAAQKEYRPVADLHNKYDVGSGEQFDDLVGLIEHFRSYPMVETSGDVLRLLQPLSGTRLRAHDIDKKVQEMQDQESKVDSCRGFDGEYQTLKMLDDKLHFTTEEGMKPENTNKNRYRNVLPYDQTRVVLRQGEAAQSDYINANYIRGVRLGSSTSSVQSSTESLHSVHSLILREEAKNPSSLVSKSLSDDALREVRNFIKLDKLNGNLCRELVKDKIYIATQGCLTNTTDDFWRMVWQEDIRVIAMITNEVEKGKKKCERYWPLCGEEQRYGKLLVRSMVESCHESYLVREMDVRNDSSCRTVFQYQFMTWPDHGTPEESEGILALIDDINRKMYQISQSAEAPEQNVLCVHCSAGVGRTGTFIALDMIIDKIKSSGFNCDIDVHSTVKLVRAQRGGMVQNRAQYRFIYLALQDYIESHTLRPRRKVVYT